MKKCFLCIISVVMLFMGCATSGGRSGMSLQEAIEQSAAKIIADLPAGSIIAVTAFESNNDDLSKYIMRELTGALIDRGAVVASRQTLEYIEREFDFQLSGYVSDESAQSLGRMVGAQVIIVGGLTDIGRTYRFTADAVFVEEARHGGTVRLDVLNNNTTQRMISTIASQQTPERSRRNETTPSSALDFLELGITLAMRGEYELAYMNFSEAIELDPNLIGAYILRGRALYAYASDILDVDAGENFGRVHFDFDDMFIPDGLEEFYFSAGEDFTKAISLSPNSSIAYAERGLMYLFFAAETHYGQGRDREMDQLARNDLNQAIRLNPHSALAYYYRGIAHMAWEDADRAISDFSRVIELDPNFLSAYYYRSRIYSEIKGDYDRAIADYSRLLENNPTVFSGYGYVERGDLYFEKNDYDRAIADYEASLQIDPSRSWVRDKIEEARRLRGR